MMPCRPVAAALAVALLLPVAACSDGSAGNSGGETGRRSVTHAMGTTLVPTEPVRVVVLDASALDAVVALGITPVGAPRVRAGGPAPDYIVDALGPGAATITATGGVARPDLSAVRALRPDLILGNRQRHRPFYDRLRAIAPTVMAKSAAGRDWKQRFLLDAQALGRRSDAERVLDRYAERADLVARAWRNPSAVRVALVRFAPDPTVLGPGSFAGAVLSDVGFTVTGSLAQADVLFSSGAGPAGLRAAAGATRTATWRGLPAVAAERSIQVGDQIWFRAIGPVGARLLLDDLLRYAQVLVTGPRSS